LPESPPGATGHRRFRHGPDDYRPLFTRIDDTPLTVQVRRGKQPARTLRLYRCYGYRGGYVPER
jgi:hypothetical protein